MSQNSITLTLSNGLSVPALAYGTGTKWFAGAAGNKMESEINRELVESIKTCLHSGFLHVDTAEMYGTEKEVGIALAEFLKEKGLPRSSIYITTKVYTNVADISRGLSDSLARLGPAVEGYVDLYLIHAPFWDKSKITMKEAWQQMELMVDQGKTKSIGVSNFRIKDLEEILSYAKIRPVVNQIEYHAYLQAPALKAFCEKNQIVIAAFGPLLPITSFAQEGAVKDVAQQIAGPKGANEGQVLLSWSLKQGNIVVTTSNKKSRMIEYVQAQGIQLSDQEAAEISKAGKDKKLRKFWDRETFD